MRLVRDQEVTSSILVVPTTDKENGLIINGRFYYLMLMFISQNSNLIHRPNNDIANVGIDIANPYLIKSRKLNFKPSFLIIPIHIMPAKAPKGVKYAAMLVAMIVEYNAPFEKGINLRISENKTLKGILFIILAPINAVMPKLNIG